MKADDPVQVAFLDRLYRETLDLLNDTRDFVTEDVPVESTPESQEDKIERILLVAGLTRQLTDAMAWLLAQKAVQAGEIDVEVAEAGAFQPDTGAVDAVLSAQSAARLPMRLRGLIDRGRRLHHQVIQLAR